MSTATESFTWTTPCEFSGHFTVNIVPGHVRIYAGQEVEPAYLLVEMTPPSAPAPLSREDVLRVLVETDRAVRALEILASHAASSIAFELGLSAEFTAAASQARGRE